MLLFYVNESEYPFTESEYPFTEPSWSYSGSYHIDAKTWYRRFKHLKEKDAPHNGYLGSGPGLFRSKLPGVYEIKKVPPPIFLKLLYWATDGVLHFVEADMKETTNKKTDTKFRDVTWEVLFNFYLHACGFNGASLQNAIIDRMIEKHTDTGEVDAPWKVMKEGAVEKPQLRRLLCDMVIYSSDKSSALDFVMKNLDSDSVSGCYSDLRASLYQVAKGEFKTSAIHPFEKDPSHSHYHVRYNKEDNQVFEDDGSTAAETLKRH